jgi:hypothetical protein
MSETGKDLTATGGCLCGAVRYEVRGPLRDVRACHCEQCRRTSGHFVAATAAKTDDLTLTEDKGLRWYRSSDSAERGFCSECGSSVFWRGVDSPYTAIMAGTMDTPTGLRMVAHIFTQNASDYYGLDDDLPKFPEGYPAKP